MSRTVTDSLHLQFAADVRAAKQGLRARIRAERRHRIAALVETGPEGTGRDPIAEAARRLAEVTMELPRIRRARCVALYASMPGEPETAPLRAALQLAGKRALLPIALPSGDLDWAEDTGTLETAPGPGGPVPVGPRLGVDAVREAELVLVPALAVDTLGHRLGQGAGYYDRALDLVPRGVPVIALLHEGELLDAAVEAVPVEPHDRRVDAVITAARCLWLDAG